MPPRLSKSVSHKPRGAGRFGRAKPRERAKSELAERSQMGGPYRIWQNEAKREAKSE